MTQEPDISQTCGFIRKFEGLKYFEIQRAVFVSIYFITSTNQKKALHLLLSNVILHYYTGEVNLKTAIYLKLLMQHEMHLYH